ncbi:MAG TPA: hypothetical protein H9803_03005 [Candidatus Ligilactobacillus excrementavium]|nr:hypothetical protein [Candidatus Ligilactobacillus excrementavium]
MQNEESIIEEIKELEQNLRGYIDKGKSTEAVHCQQKILKNKLKLAKLRNY